MHFNKFYFDFFYLFITNIDQQIFKNILKFKGIVIVYNHSYIADLAQFIEIQKFCKKNNVKFIGGVVDYLGFNSEGFQLSKKSTESEATLKIETLLVDQVIVCAGQESENQIHKKCIENVNLLGLLKI